MRKHLQLFPIFFLIAFLSHNNVYAQTIAIDINSVSVGMYSGSGSDCGDCISTPDPYVGVRFKHSGTATWGGVGQSNRDDVGCDSYGGVGGYSASGIAWSGTTIQLEIQGKESDGVVCANDDGNCGLGGPSSGTNNLLIIQQPSCGTNNGQYSSNRENCASDGSTNDYRARWNYRWWWDASSITASTTAGVINANVTDICDGGVVTIGNTTNGTLYPRGTQLIQQSINGAAYTDVSTGTTNTTTNTATTNHTFTTGNLPIVGGANTTYQYRRVVRYCTDGSGGTTDYVSNVVTVNVVPDPNEPSATKSPDLTSVCVGTTIALTSPVKGSLPGQACSGFQYSINGGAYGATSTFTSTLGTNTIAVRVAGGCASGCGASAATTYTWNVVAQPVGPSGGTKTPNLTNICAGTDVSFASTTAGTGGFGCSDDYIWLINGVSQGAYTLGTNVGSGATAGQVITIQGRRANCTASSGCTGTAYVTLATWTVNAQPVGPSGGTKTPNLTNICVGTNVSFASATAGTGGFNCSDDYRWLIDGVSQGAYTLGTNVGSGATAGQVITIQGRRANCTALSGCTGTAYTDLATWTVNAQPVGPSGGTKTPNLTNTCVGTNVSLASTTAGTGGFGCSDDYIWLINGVSQGAYTLGSNVGSGATAGQVITIQGRRANCTATAGCTGTAYVTLATWTVNAQPVGPTGGTKTPNLTNTCEGTNVSLASTTAGTGGFGCSDDYIWLIDGVSQGAYTLGTNVGSGATAGQIITIQGRRENCTATAGCTGTSYVTLATWTVNAQPVGPTGGTKTPNLTNTCVGTNVSLASTTAGTGGFGCSDDYIWLINGVSQGAYTLGSNVGSGATAGQVITIQGRRANCTASSGCTGTAYTDLATWTIVADPTLSAPVSQTMCLGGSVSITSNESGGAGTFDLQWQYSPNGTSGWASVADGAPSNITYSGNTTNTLTISGNGSEAVSSANYYRLLLTPNTPSSSGCNAISSNAQLTVVSDPALTAPTASQTICIGGTASVTSTSSGGTGNYDYQWEYSANGTSGWAAVSNGTPSGVTYTGGSATGVATGTSSTLTVIGDGSEATGNKYYRLVLSSNTPSLAGCSQISSTALITTVVNPALTTPLALQTICKGGNASVTSTIVSGGTGTYNYDWEYSANGTSGWANVVDGTPSGITYSGGATTSLTVTGNGSEAAASKFYRLQVTSNTPSLANCVATSAVAEIETVVKPSLTNPTPASQTVCLNGAPASITTTPSSGTASAYTIQWYENTSNSTTGGTLMGTGGSIFSNTSLLGTLYYYAVVTQPESGCTFTTAATASVTVVALPTSGTLTKSPNTADVCEGSNVSATATSGAGGTGTITDVLEYRRDDGGGFHAWTAYTSGDPISTTGYVTIEIQTYRTATGSGCNTSATNTVSWTINPQPVSGTLAKTPNTTNVCEGTPVSAALTAGTGGAGTVTDVLEYRFNGTGGWSAYTSGTNLATTGKTLVEIRTYRTATGPNCSTPASTVTVTWVVEPAPVATPAIDFIATCDATAQISYTVSVPGTFSWTRISGSGSPATSSDNPLTVTGLTPGGISEYRLLGSLPGCTNINLGTLNLSLPVNNSANLASVASCNICVIVDGNTRTYYNSSGELIAKIEDDALVTPSNLGETEVCVKVDGSVQTIPDNLGNLQPYLQRQWTIHPANNTNSIVTLYFKNSELNALQAAANSTVYQFSGYGLYVSKYPGGQGGTFTPPCTGGAPLCGQVTGENVPAVWSSFGSNHQVEFTINSFSTFYIAPALFPFAPLPVELISFTGWNQGTVNRLQWVTATELNTSKFVIEKSVDQGVWSVIGEKTAAGNSSQRLTYDFTDNSPIVGNNYYRLKVVDLDNTFSYSNTINIPVGEALVNNFTRIYPNPTNGLLNVEIQSTDIYDTKIVAYDAIGKKVLDQSSSLNKGLNTLQLDFSQFANGSYILQFSDITRKIHTTKFVKD